MDLDLRIDGLFTEDEKILRATARRFVEKEVLPIIGEAFEAGRFPAELVGPLARLGLIGMKVHGYGCAGMSNVAYGIACEELEAGDSGLRSFMSVMNSLFMYPVESFGSEEQKQRWLPAMAKGEAIGCFGLTEAHGGSDPASNKTHAKKSGGDWIINGSKMWITNGSVADVALVWARTDDGARAFLVEKGARGFTAADIKHKMSMRASVTSELALSDARVPESARLPGVTGLRQALMCLNEARFGIGWGAMGAARSCFEAALDFAKDRVLFGRTLASRQLTQAKLARMQTELVKARLLALHVGRMKDKGDWDHNMISMLKMNNVGEALKIAREARGILGAYGISLEYPVIRHMNNLESVYTYEGANEVHQLILGLAITGENAF
ncbi:MAG TPA: acyl-CoA dehydrogenase family protein [bacterium]|nr:acyl-CoA dehydrogenase family protein [bacterium]